MWSSTGNNWKAVDPCRIGIVPNYLTLFYCKSCSVCFSTWKCVLYLWDVTSGVFYILAGIHLPFLCIFLFVWLFEKCVNCVFPIFLTGRELTSELFGGTVISQYKGVCGPFSLCLRMFEHLNCEFLTVFEKTLTEGRKKPCRACLQSTEVSKEVFNDIYISSFPSWISTG